MHSVLQLADGTIVETMKYLKDMAAENSALKARVEELEKQKDGAYAERDRLVAALSKVFPSHLARHPESDETWDDDWRWIVCIHLPDGQATWHIHDSEFKWFSHLRQENNHWDGHTTEEKYKRLGSLKEQL
jgi:hypothetical protein